MSAISTNTTSAVSASQIDTWWDGLGPARQTILSYAASNAEIEARMAVRKGNRSKADAWKTLPKDNKEHLLGRLFNGTIDTILKSTEAESRLITDEERFRGIDKLTVDVMARETGTNEYLSGMRTGGESGSDGEACPSRLAVDHYIQANYDKKDYESGPTQEVDDIRKTWDKTRAMVDICARSSFQEIGKIVSDSHCPTGWKNEKAGLVPMYRWMKDKSLFSSESAAWNTTRNREKSAMRLEPRHFETFGQPPLPRDQALWDRAKAVEAEGGTVSQTSKGSQNQVTFDVPQPSASTKPPSTGWGTTLRSWLPWGSKLPETNTQASDTGTATTALTSNPATTATAPSGTAPSAPSANPTQNSTVPSTAPAFTGIQSPWAGGSSAPPAQGNSPHFGFGPNPQAVPNAPSTSSQDTTRGGPFGGTYIPGTSSGTGTTKKSSLSSGNSGKRKKGVGFAGIAPGKTDVGGSVKKPSLLNRMFSNTDKIDGSMISSSARQS